MSYILSFYTKGSASHTVLPPAFQQWASVIFPQEGIKTAFFLLVWATDDLIVWMQRVKINAFSTTSPGLTQTSLITVLAVADGENG